MAKDFIAPVNPTPDEAHLKDKAARQARQQLNYPTAVACLDPEAAKSVVDARPKQRYRVTFDHPKQGSKSAVVVATSDREAKAVFADRHPQFNYPGPRELGWKVESLGAIEVPQGV